MFCQSQDIAIIHGPCLKNFPTVIRNVNGLFSRPAPELFQEVVIVSHFLNGTLSTQPQVTLSNVTFVQEGNATLSLHLHQSGTSGCPVIDGVTGNLIGMIISYGERTGSTWFLRFDEKAFVNSPHIFNNQTRYVCEQTRDIKI